MINDLSKCTFKQEPWMVWPVRYFIFVRPVEECSVKCWTHPDREIEVWQYLSGNMVGFFKVSCRLEVTRPDGATVRGPRWAVLTQVAKIVTETIDEYNETGNIDV